jgi:hypothetical protein
LPRVRYVKKYGGARDTMDNVIMAWDVRTLCRATRANLHVWMRLSVNVTWWTLPLILDMKTSNSYSYSVIFLNVIFSCHK